MRYSDFYYPYVVKYSRKKIWIMQDYVESCFMKLSQSITSNIRIATLMIMNYMCFKSLLKMRHILIIELANSREDPPNRLTKMGAMPTPFRGSNRTVEDTPPLQSEREEPRAETPPGELVSPFEYSKLK